MIFNQYTLKISVMKLDNFQFFFWFNCLNNKNMYVLSVVLVLMPLFVFRIMKIFSSRNLNFCCTSDAVILKFFLLFKPTDQDSSVQHLPMLVIRCTMSLTMPSTKNVKSNYTTTTPMALSSSPSKVVQMDINICWIKRVPLSLR